MEKLRSNYRGELILLLVHVCAYALRKYVSRDQSFGCTKSSFAAFLILLNRSSLTYHLNR